MDCKEIQPVYSKGDQPWDFFGGNDAKAETPVFLGFPGGSDGKKNPPTMRKTCVQSLGWEDPLEKGMATHSSILAWRIPRTVYSLGSQRVGHN